MIVDQQTNQTFRQLKATNQFPEFECLKTSVIIAVLTQSSYPHIRKRICPAVYKKQSP
ncbi:hypothetical protein TTHERM_00672170 (macronuclear) [Tetrahymena thermophila SB210]|uniref:Uncharacterized protein n=1 Tax=Tetrahymena thermophila (strain SB210) TaxID=312017 RepID=Q23E38_TETTS|nr:hypothetical protein TTHERM_00672170 [Tetrahymena thermophila SB210]EAR94749.1 hypothetical protein TTHERM_00672170 [Tetrahymena thermophila SB210]|eukprot:XP_001014994.1 hypothetical protein TTHERM_00672170 [Tetrahymena thermophila SB210]